MLLNDFYLAVATGDAFDCTFFFGGICIKMTSEVLINYFKNVKCFKTCKPMRAESCLAAV